MGIEITTEKRRDDWLAFADGDRGIWECDKDKSRAVGKLYLRLRVNEVAFRLAYTGLRANYMPKLREDVARRVVEDGLKYGDPSSETAQDVWRAYQKAVAEVAA